MVDNDRFQILSNKTKEDEEKPFFIPAGVIWLDHEEFERKRLFTRTR